jgi:transcriptional regulator with XRE-family HTH domain
MSDELGQVISNARVSLGLSMRGAAKLAGISEGRWRQIEAGFKSSGNGVRETIRVRPATALAVADALGLPRGDVFKAAGLAPFTPEVVARVAEATRRESTLNRLVQASVGAGVMRVLSGGLYPFSIQGGA